MFNLTFSHLHNIIFFFSNNMKKKTKIFIYNKKFTSMLFSRHTSRALASARVRRERANGRASLFLLTALAFIALHVYFDTVLSTSSKSRIASVVGAHDAQQRHTHEYEGAAAAAAAAARAPSNASPNAPDLGRSVAVVFRGEAFRRVHDDGWHNCARCVREQHVAVQSHLRHIVKPLTTGKVHNFTRVEIFLEVYEPLANGTRAAYARASRASNSFALD